MKDKKSLRLFVPIALLVVGGVVSIGADAVVQDPLPRIVTKCAAVLMIASPGILSFARAEQRARQASAENSAKEGVAELEEMLFQAIPILFDGEPPHRLRANVMIKAGQHLQMFCSANMKIFPDYQMRLSIGQGCAGAAWQKAIGDPISDCWKPVYAPRAQLTGNQLQSRWKLSREQIRLTGHIRWVLSVPLFRNDRGKREFFGVLNFDGVNGELLRPARLKEKRFIGNCAAVGERIAEHVTTRCIRALEALTAPLPGGSLDEG